MKLCEYCRVELVFANTHKGGFCKYCVNLPIAGNSYTYVVSGDYDTVSIGTYKTPDDVTALKGKLGALVVSINNDVASCPDVPDDVRLSWISFRNQFEEYYHKTSPITSSDSDYTTGLGYQDQIRSWQLKLSFYCKLSSPIIPDSQTSNPTVAQTVNKALDTGRTVAIIGGILGIGLIAYGIYLSKKNAEKGLELVKKHPELLGVSGLAF